MGGKTYSSSKATIHWRKSASSFYSSPPPPPPDSYKFLHIDARAPIFYFGVSELGLECSLKMYHITCMARCLKFLGEVH